MHRRLQAIAVPAQIGDFAAEIHRIFSELGRGYGSD